MTPDRSGTDRRALFFVGASLAGLILTFVADAAHRWVAIAVCAVYAVLAVVSALDARARDKAQPRYGRRRD